ncbi:MAG: GAF domain-containing protein, partial [Chloroflexi bacterium]|nr:GAF domain-containing protein [Chloroflexota bacterium]
MTQGQTEQSPPSDRPYDSSPGIGSRPVGDSAPLPEYEGSIETLDGESLPPVSDLLESILEHAAGLVHADKCQLFLTQADGRSLRLAAARNFPKTSSVAISVGEGLAGRVASSGQAISYSGERQAETATDVDVEGPFRCMGVPMIARGRVLGVLSIVDEETNVPFEPDQVLAVQLFAEQAAISLENTQLLADAKQQATQFAALLETANELAAQHNLSKLLQTILDRARALLGSAGGFIYLYDSEREEMELVIEHGMPMPLGMRLKLDEGMAGMVARSRRPLIVDDYQAWDRRSD